jgi:hypothetical protein
VIREKSQFRAQDDFAVIESLLMTASALSNFRALAALSFWGGYFSPQHHAGRLAFRSAEEWRWLMKRKTGQKRNGNNGYRERLSKKQRWLSKK